MDNVIIFSGIYLGGGGGAVGTWPSFGKKKSVLTIDKKFDFLVQALVARENMAPLLNLIIDSNHAFHGFEILNTRNTRESHNIMLC